MMNKTKILFSAWVVALLSATNVSIAKATVDGEPYLSKSFSVADNTQLVVKTSGVSVAVEGSESNQVLVEMYATKNGKPLNPDDPEIKKKLENYDLDISQQGDQINVILESKGKDKLSSGKNSVSFSFKVFTPDQVSSDFTTSGGSISLVGVEGKQHLKSSGGGIKVANCSGGIYVKSSGGSLSINQFEGSADLASSGGSVKVNGLLGEMAIQSSGGSINLDDVSGKIKAEASGGSIKAVLASLDDELSLKSSGGSISATVPKSIGMDIALYGGSIRTELNNFEGQTDKQKIQGKLNGGGIPVTMASSGGSISLKYK